MIVSHKTHIRICRFRDWFQSEAQKHPTARTKLDWNNRIRLHCHEFTIDKMIREIGMSTKKKSDKIKWRGYKNITIPSKHADRVDKFIASDNEVFALYNQMLVDGYSVKFAYDEDNESVRCTLYCQNPEDVNAGYATGAWASDWYTALAVALYKHHEIAKQNWDGYEPPQQRRFG